MKQEYDEFIGFPPASKKILKALTDKDKERLNIKAIKVLGLRKLRKGEHYGLGDGLTIGAMTIAFAVAEHEAKTKKKRKKKSNG